MRKILKSLTALLVVAMVAVSCMTNAFAVTGSIKVTMVYDGMVLTDGVLTLYHVADSTYSFTDDFAGCDLDLSDLGDSTLPWLLWQWALQTGVTGTSMVVESDGTVTFPNLEPGVYLVVPTVNPAGYDMTPSVVPVPFEGEYDVEIEPKIDPSTTPTDPSDPTLTPTTPTTTDDEVLIDEEEPEPEDEDPSPGETLPQTGQLNYPIPIMAGTGAVCVAAGFILTKTDKKR